MEKDKLNKDRAAQCPRCTCTFECRPDNIALCNCSEIELSKEEYGFISSKYQVCVCNKCLTELKEEFSVKASIARSAGFTDGKFSLALLFFLLSGILFGQAYAPPAGQAGTTAIYKDSSVFVNWATGSSINRGYQDISNTSLGFATVGDTTMATGKAESNGVVSLGDGGSVICTFAKPVMNGPGFDFAVFENSFDDVFLELAFVEVSSDGVNFFRFHAHSLTDTVTQTGSFGPSDATKINNLAGKYRGGYGTPFDLQELAGTGGLDINNVTHIKIIDVVGSINESYATRDFFHNKINDPWPTPFPSGGFDLDAIGVIHESSVVGIAESARRESFRVYPNPVGRGGDLRIENPAIPFLIEILDVAGKCVLTTRNDLIQTEGLEEGLYFVRVITDKMVATQKLIVR